MWVYEFEIISTKDFYYLDGHNYEEAISKTTIPLSELRLIYWYYEGPEIEYEE